MAFVSSIRLHSLLVLAVGASACVVPDVNLEGRPCPCTSGWVCDDGTNICVRSEVDGAVPDGGGDSSSIDSSRTDSSPTDSSRPDADASDTGTDARDTGLDACSTAVVTQEWGDHPGSDFRGTVLDTWINLNMEHFASATELLLYTWPTAQVANAIIIKWDLSAIPADATITGASVQLHQWEAIGADYRVGAHRIMGCDPDIAGDQVSGYQCAAGRPWTPNRCCTRDVPMGQADIAAADDVHAVDTVDGLKSWDVTDMVQMWVTTPSTNLGMMLNSDASAPADDRRSYRSSEYATASERPRLVVTYSSCD